MRAADFLAQAQSEMEDRASTYDQPGGARSMAKTIRTFNALTGHGLTEEQGWKFMICLKLARSEQGDMREDNFVDGAAYFGLAGETATRVALHERVAEEAKEAMNDKADS